MLVLWKMALYRYVRSGFSPFWMAEFWLLASFNVLVDPEKGIESFRPVRNACRLRKWVGAKNGIVCWNLCWKAATRLIFPLDFLSQRYAENVSYKVILGVDLAFGGFRGVSWRVLALRGLVFGQFQVETENLGNCCSCWWSGEIQWIRGNFLRRVRIYHPFGSVSNGYRFSSKVGGVVSEKVDAVGAAARLRSFGYLLSLISICFILLAPSLIVPCG